MIPDDLLLVGLADATLAEEDEDEDSSQGDGDGELEALIEDVVGPWMGWPQRREGTVQR